MSRAGALVKTTLSSIWLTIMNESGATPESIVEAQGNEIRDGTSTPFYGGR